MLEKKKISFPGGATAPPAPPLCTALVSKGVSRGSADRGSVFVEISAVSYIFVHVSPISLKRVVS